MTAPLVFTFRLLCLALVLGTGLALSDRLLLSGSNIDEVTSQTIAEAAPTVSQDYIDIPAREPGLRSVMRAASDTFDMPVFDLASLSPGYRAPYAPTGNTQKPTGASTPARWLKFLPLPRRKPIYVSRRPPIYDWQDTAFFGQAPPGPIAAKTDAAYVSAPAQPTVTAYNQAGYDALSAGDPLAALRFFNQSLDLDRNQPLIHSQKGYIYKSQGRYKTASRAFGTAGAGGGFATPSQPGLVREAAYLKRPLRLSGYTVWRQDSRSEGEISFGPSLAQSQSGLGATYRLPIDGWASKHELSAYSRLLWAYEPMSLVVNGQSYQAGVGVQVRPFSNLNLVTAAERLVGLGDQARDDWLLRASYSTGAGYAPLEGERSWLHWSVYGDVAVIDPAQPDLQLTGEGRVGFGNRPFANSSFTVIPFAGASANFQDAAGVSTSLYEASAGLWMRYWPGGASLPDPQRALDLRMEYRAKVGGDSASASGLLLTLGVTY